MVEIFSKQSGPDRRDQEMKRFLGENRPTIERLADHLSQGSWSARKSAPDAPSPHQPTRLGYVPPTDDTKIEARVRISPNDRVVLVNHATSRQIAFLGMIRGARNDRRFVLATKDNGFFDPLDQDLQQLLLGVDGLPVNGSDAEDELARTINAQLGLPNGEADQEAGD